MEDCYLLGDVINYKTWDHNYSVLQGKILSFLVSCKKDILMDVVYGKCSKITNT